MEEAADDSHNTTFLTSLDAGAPQYTCPICTVNQFTRSALLCHLTSKHEDRLVAMCKVCHQLFPSSEIESHVVRCKGVHVCPYCRSTFAIASYLQRHITRQHTSFSRAICDICGKSLSSAAALTAHKRLHTGDLPHSCKLCGARYPQKCHLKLHIESHHANVELHGTTKRHNCKICNRSFLFATSLQHHRAQHSRRHKRKLICACDRSFAYRSEYDRHICGHSKTVSHRCPLCPRVFTRTSLLRTHLLLHTDPACLTCEYCYRRYSSRTYLLHHMKRKHFHDRQLPKTPSVSSLSTNCGGDTLSLLVDFPDETTQTCEYALTAADAFLTTLPQGVIESEEADGIHDSFLDEVPTSDSESLHLTDTTPNVNYLHAVLYGTCE